MPVHIVAHATLQTTTVAQGSHSFLLILPFTIEGYDVTEDIGTPIWKAILINPDGIETTKDVILSSGFVANPFVGYLVSEGELDRAGIYTYQVILMDGTHGVKSEIGNFIVEESLPS
jgi:hypothetical protein